MGFFTNDWNLANAYNSPSVGRTQAFKPGAGSLSSSMNLNPYQQFGQMPNQYSQPQTNWGAPNAVTGFNPQQGYTNQEGFNQNFIGQYNPLVPWWQQGQMQVPSYPTQPQVQPQPQLQQPTDGGDSDWQEPTGPVSEFDPSAWNLDWLGDSFNTNSMIGSQLGGMILGVPGMLLGGYLGSQYGDDTNTGTGMFGGLGDWVNSLFDNTPTNLNQQAATGNDYWDNYTESVEPAGTTDVGPYSYDTYEGIGVGGSDVGVESPSSSSSDNDYGSSSSGWGSNDSSGESYSADDAGDAAAMSDWGDW